MDGRSLSVRGHRRRERRPFAPFWLFAAPALVLTLIAVWFIEGRRPSRSSAPTPEVADPDQAVAGFAGRVESSGGAVLEVALAPLHADPDQLRFDADVLRRRFGLGDGVPWRLVVSWAGEPDTDATPETPQRGDVGLSLGEMFVEDGAGVALVPLVLREDGVAEAARIDPLRTLLAPPRGALFAGETVELLLFGRAPGDDARLGGLLPEGEVAGDFQAASGLAGPLVLRPRSMRRGDLSHPLVRLVTGETPGGRAGLDAEAARLSRPVEGDSRDAGDAGDHE